MSEPTLPVLQHDCAACSALCCVVLPFDADQGFGFDKEANTPCQHLQTDFTCGIHTALETAGFRGCIHYGCHGAGQRTTRLFGEVNWRANPTRADEIFSVFSRLQKLHALQAMLVLAAQRVASTPWHAKLLAQQQQIEALCRQVELQEPVEVELAHTDTMTLLRQLATEPAIVALRTSNPRGN